MSKAVMKQAMDALKYNQSNWYGKREAVAALETELAKPQHPDLRKAAEMALEALKAWDALIKYQYGGSSEAMTAMQNVAWRTLDTIEGLETALAQTEQQPVAWMMPDYGDVLSASEADGTGIYNIPLYTSPPRKEWVGLTDEEIKGILDCGRGGLVDIKKAEQILKEKNK